MTVTAGTKAVLYSFTVGEECELETFTGEKAKVRSGVIIHVLTLDIREKNDALLNLKGQYTQK